MPEGVIVRLHDPVVGVRQSGGMSQLVSHGADQ
jgi:hypothetical protein